VHSITLDRARNLVEVRLSGFFAPEDAAKAGEDVRAAIRSLGAGAGQHLTLYDVGEVQIAPGPTMELLASIFGNPEYQPLFAKRVAFVTPSALARLQLQRLRQARADIGIYDTRANALGWLLS
jgi:hypothetical protein